MVEQTSNETADNGPQGQGSETTRKRMHSEVEFPYSDLRAAVDLAQTIHGNAGSSCEDRELAGWLNQSVDGGTYRSRRSSARLFGLISISQGRLTLTDLGHDVTDASKAPAARAKAFLRPELYTKMYELHGGKILPPAAAIERQMGEVGVSPKQKERARQVFYKSATYAGFIDSSTGRFVKPANVGAHARSSEIGPGKKDSNGKGSGGDDGGNGENDPIIRGLLARLPKAGSVWPEAERQLWLQILEGSFKLIYKEGPCTDTPDAD